MEAQPTRHRNWRYESVCRRFARYVRTGRVVILRQNSEAALANFEDGSLDYVYIDGNHLYEFVKKDLELSLRKVKMGRRYRGR
jgi:Methyltransferase domain